MNSKMDFDVTTSLSLVETQHMLEDSEAKRKKLEFENQHLIKLKETLQTDLFRIQKELEHERQKNANSEDKIKFNQALLSLEQESAVIIILKIIYIFFKRKATS